jgi:hypothetical protein
MTKGWRKQSEQHSLASKGIKTAEHKLVARGQEKFYKILIDKDGREPKYIEGTLDYLINYFGYTLEIGHSWNNSIKTKPKTIKAFINNLQKSYYEKEASCYQRTSVKLIEKE